MERRYYTTLAISTFVLALSLPPHAGAQESAMQEAERLSTQVGQFFQQGRYQEAIPLAQRVLAIIEKVSGPDDPEIVVWLGNLGLLYHRTGAYEKAEPLYQRALASREKALGPDHPDTAAALNILAELYFATGAYEKAEPLCQRALTIREKALGPDHPDTAVSLNNLAQLYIVSGDYAKAEPLHQRALAIREKAFGTDNPATAVSLNNLGGLYHLTGAYGQAEPLYRRALAIIEKALGPDHPDTATALTSLARIYEDTGAYAKAEPLQQRALAITEKALGPGHPDTATALNNLAQLYKATGAYVQAEPLYQRALAITEKALGPGHPTTATILGNLAVLYKDTGAYAKAEPLYRRALAITEKALGPDHPNTARSLNNLAMLYRDTGEYAQAEPLYQRALAINEKALGPDHPLTAIALNNLALLYGATGAYTQTEPLYQRALTITEKALGPEHADTALALNNLAYLYQVTGNHAQAEPLYQRSLAIREKTLGPDHPDIAVSLNNLAALYQATGAYVQAAALNERAQRVDEINTARFMLFGSEARKRAYLQQRLVNAYADVSLSLTVADPRAIALGLTAVLQHKGRVLDAISNSVGRLRQSAAPEDQAVFDQLAAVAQEVSTLTFGAPGNLALAAYRQRLEALAQQREKLEAELSTRSAAFRQALAPITLEGVRQALPADAALVEWFRYRPFDPKSKDEKARFGVPQYVAYVLTRTGEPVAIDLGAAQPIDALVTEFRTALSDPRRTYFTEVAERLSEKLVKPLHPYLAESARLLLSPDGALNLVPFAALVDDRGEYVGQRLELTYLTSGRDLLRFTAESPARGSAVVVANPAYGETTGQLPAVDPSLKPARSGDLDRSGLVFTALAGTAAEAKSLQALLKLDPRNVLTGADATETSLKQLHSPRLLHVATHGFFLDDREMAAVPLKAVGSGLDGPLQPFGENPLLRSGLALAGANARRPGAADDGILTAAEAAQLDLRGTQLVVLSACETGVGQIQTGEGVYGLRRALVLAGVQTQIASLWKVDDAATKDLMVDYYQRLLNGAGRSEALREAQKAMLANPARRHPYYWAAFVPIGNWTALPKGQ